MTPLPFPAAAPARDEATYLDVLNARADAARDAHHELHAAFMRHIRWAWGEDSDDWRCRTGGSCDEADRIHREATAAGERLDLAQDDLTRAMRAHLTIVS